MVYAFAAKTAYFVADQEPPAPPAIRPLIELPVTLPVYFAGPTVNVISSPFILASLIWRRPERAGEVLEFLLERQVRRVAAAVTFQVPSTLAGTNQSSAVHQPEQSPLIVSC